MNANEKIAFIQWMEQKCKETEEGVSFFIPSEWVELEEVRNFRTIYNQQNPLGKIAVLAKGEQYEVVRVPYSLNVKLFEGIAKPKKRNKKDYAKECRQRIEDAIADFFKGNFPESYVAGINDVETLREKEVIPYKYLRLKVGANICFKRAAEEEGKSIGVYLRTILQDLVDEKILFPIPVFEAKEEFDTEAELYIKVAE